MHVIALIPNKVLLNAPNWESENTSVDKFFRVGGLIVVGGLDPRYEKRRGGGGDAVRFKPDSKSGGGGGGGGGVLYTSGTIRKAGPGGGGGGCLAGYST